MRKVSVVVDAVVMVPMQVEGTVVVQIDEGKSIALAVKKLLTGRKCVGAELVDSNLWVHGVNSGEETDLENIPTTDLLINDVMFPNKVTFNNIEVVDSK